RYTSAVAFIVFMLLIMITGNYGFFNLATITLCLLLFDDAVLKRWFGTALPPSTVPVAPIAAESALGVALFVLLLILSVNLGFRILGLRHRCLNPLENVCSWFDRFRI